MIAIMLASVLAYLPNPTTTPGELNPAVRQENIEETICKPGWTKTIRPTVSYTNSLKRRQLADLGADVPMNAVEEDHSISLQLGGDPTSPRNLWPEPWDGPWGARRKDVLETFLKRQVCAGKMTLDQAREEIRTDWIASYLSHPELPPVSAPHP